MAEKIQKCPMCGTKLKMTNGRMTCKDCGYYLRDQSETADNAATAQPGPYTSTGSGMQPGPYSSAGSGAQPGPYIAPDSSTQSGKKSSGSKKSLKAVLISIASGLCIALSSRTVRTGIEDIAKLLISKNDDTPAFNYTPSLPDDIYVINTAAPSGSTATAAPGSASSGRVSPLPNSDFAISFIETVYGKDYRVITAEEYAAVTALEVDTRNNIVYYRLDAGETQYINYLENYNVNVSDLKCFPGLQQLYLEDKMLSIADSLSGLDDLWAIHTKNSAKELAKYVSHPENILDLGINDWTWDSNLNDLSSFPNLLYLTVNSSHLADISALNSFPDLLGLDLGKCDNVTDYSPLMSLTQLEELSIASSKLKTIDFIKQMPNLAYLHIEDSQIQDLSALSSCPMLTSLALEGNNKLNDYSAIGDLSSLAYLTLEVSQQTEQPLPSFQNLTGVTYLSLSNVDDLSPLRDAVNITTLLLEHCGSKHLDVLTAMPNLSYLKIDEFWGLTESLAPLTQLPNLTELNISGTKVFGNMEEIFSIPTLKYLYMDDCQVGIDFNAVAPNPNLEVLSMCNVRILKDPSYNSGDKIYLSEHYEFFDNFPNLVELYVSSANLDNIDFVANMPDLIFLDISGNNVTSLTPLLSLEKFYTVWCGGNTILENIPQNSPIRVFTDSRKR